MFDIFKSSVKKDPICGMKATDKFISKYGEKFCSDKCLVEYEKKNNIADPEKSEKRGCCH